MRPLTSPGGKVLKAHLLTLPTTISTSANGVVTTQLSFLPPASSSATEVPASSDSLPATAQPPEPPPTTTKSNVSLMRVPLVVFCRSFPTAFAGNPPLLRGPWQGRVRKANFREKTGIFHVIKSSKGALLPFPKGAGIDTYAPHPPALARVAFSGSLWKRTGRRLCALGGFRFRSCPRSRN